MKPATKPSLHIFAATLATAVALCGAAPSPTTGPSQPSRAAFRRTVEAFDITKEPTPADWRFFIKAKEASREKLWSYNVHRGKTLGDWAWGWRLGWVRVCAQSERPFCAQLLETALADDALVVRAEAATRLGRRFEGTGNPHVAQLLETAFADRRNTRAGKPMFVQARILFALHGLGGDAPVGTGRRLAAAHPTLAAYWAKLEADQGN